MDEIKIYTDGAASPNPGSGGYGAVMISGEKRNEISGGFELTTNNRMEIFSVIASLEALTKPTRVSIYSDSKYVVNAIMKGWATRWQANKGWKNKKEKAKNWDLWQRYFVAAEEHTVMLLWVKGHAGLPGNERADELATEAATQPDLPPDDGYLAELKIGAANQTMDLFGDPI